MISYILLVSRQGKLRLTKWYVTLPPKARAKIARDVTNLVIARRQRMCNILEYKGKKVIYRKYASLYFICEIAESDNELVALEILHRYVEMLDRYFGNVCELDIIYNFDIAYSVLDELIIGGEFQESSKNTPLKVIKIMDQHEKSERLQQALNDSGFL